MPRRRQHEIPEPPQHVRTDRLALVGRQHPAHRAFLAEHVEVIEPELRQPLFELRIAQHRTGDERGLHLGGDGAGAAIRREHLAEFAARHVTARHPLLDVGGGTRIVAKELSGGGPEHRVLRQGLGHRRRRSRIRGQLPLEVGGQPHRLHAGRVCRPGPVAEAIERVQNPLVLGQRRRRKRQSRRPVRRLDRPLGGARRPQSRPDRRAWFADTLRNRLTSHQTPAATSLTACAPRDSLLATRLLCPLCLPASRSGSEASAPRRAPSPP